jgi:hypothetical protein
MENNYLQVQIDNIREDIAELKLDSKEKGQEIESARDFRIRTEIKLDIISETLEVTNKTLVEMKNKPILEWNKLKNGAKMAIIATVIGFIIPWVIGNFITFSKIIGGM